ncbi:ECF transporter S component [Gracilibacillus oryzae]|uniref:ECF transporter S component n=1 Tax=Gracilibacillus oryzae TaxID=1672701 RepID=A0A7C8GUP7_9BACI|nr:ECF transporter S component [Gracilibacillus oryzae]KAB8138369.1 ECF transporter S component [Gracilibacillus oryzae]
MRLNVHKLTFLALLSAAAVVGRVFFQILPNVQPVSAIIIITGYFLGPYYACLLAVVTVYLSNLVLGMGLWTIWQMIAWGIVGYVAGLFKLYHWKRPLIPLTLYSFFAAYLYGLILDLGTYTYSGHFYSYFLASLPFSTFHAAGNIVFMIILYPVFQRLFRSRQITERFHK